MSLKTTSEMVESPEASIRHFLQHLDPDFRRIIRLECLHLKIFKIKHSAAFNRLC